MTKHHLDDAGHIARRVRLSTREIALSVALTIAALAAIVAARMGAAPSETAATAIEVDGKAPR